MERKKTEKPPEKRNEEGSQKGDRSTYGTRGQTAPTLAHRTQGGQEDVMVQETPEVVEERIVSVGRERMWRQEQRVKVMVYSHCTLRKAPAVWRSPALLVTTHWNSPRSSMDVLWMVSEPSGPTLDRSSRPGTADSWTASLYHVTTPSRSLVTQGKCAASPSSVVWFTGGMASSVPPVTQTHTHTHTHCRLPVRIFRITRDLQNSRATVTERLACSPPANAIRVQSPARSLRIFARGNRAGQCRWSAGFPWGSPVSPALSFRRCSMLTSITHIGFQDLAAEETVNGLKRANGVGQVGCLRVFVRTVDGEVEPCAVGACGRRTVGEVDAALVPAAVRLADARQVDGASAVGGARRHQAYPVPVLLLRFPLAKIRERPSWGSNPVCTMWQACSLTAQPPRPLGWLGALHSSIRVLQDIVSSSSQVSYCLSLPLFKGNSQRSQGIRYPARSLIPRRPEEWMGMEKRLDAGLRETGIPGNTHQPSATSPRSPACEISRVGFNGNRTRIATMACLCTRHTITGLESFHTMFVCAHPRRTDSIVKVAEALRCSGFELRWKDTRRGAFTLLALPMTGAAYLSILTTLMLLSARKPFRKLINSQSVWSQWRNNLSAVPAAEIRTSANARRVCCHSVLSARLLVPAQDVGHVGREVQLAVEDGVLAHPRLHIGRRLVLLQAEREAGSVRAQPCGTCLVLIHSLGPTCCAEHEEHYQVLHGYWPPHVCNLETKVAQCQCAIPTFHKSTTLQPHTKHSPANLLSRVPPQFRQCPASPQCSRVLRAPSRTVGFTRRVPRPFVYSHHEHLVHRRPVVRSRTRCAWFPDFQNILAPVVRLSGSPAKGGGGVVTQGQASQLLIIHGLLRKMGMQHSSEPVGPGEGRIKVGHTPPPNIVGPPLMEVGSPCELQRVTTLLLLHMAHSAPLLAHSESSSGRED
ncbi:hypothetical protein PR048_001226 [Dryococelus australis]|uniref:Uncharacterized protein n=1 Tax=Dryococelus australis TaxID=614101 RepID=A0ABQ9IGV0_9NEOP|nr:hypothetical protein PR048_001226 [Dryococelus australis]